MAGYLDESESHALEDVVAQAEASWRPLLVAIHHPSLPVGSKWLNEIGVKNAAETLEALTVLEERAVVVSGHVRQDSAQVHQGLQCLTPPSTCVKTSPMSAGFQLDALAPGCRELALYADGSWETEVRLVTD